MNRKLIGTIILAAGASTRMGFPKQLLEVEQETLIHRISRIALSLAVGPVVVVLGANSTAVASAITDLPLRVVQNPQWETGMGSTLVAGLNKLIEEFPNLHAVLTLLVDQPYISQDLLSRMLDQYLQQESLLMVAKYENTLGVPAIFSAPLFPELLQLQGQKGAKSLIRQYQKEAQLFPFPKGAIDLDTPEDWERFLGNS